MLFVVSKVFSHRSEEPRYDISGPYKSEEAFNPLPPGEHKVWDIPEDKDGWPDLSNAKRQRKDKGGHHRRVTAPAQPLDVEIL